MSYPQLQELDSLEILVVVDNELDPISPSPAPEIQQTGGLRTIGLASKPLPPDSRGGAFRELRMDEICGGAHGLSLMITGVRGEERHTILFDTGPEEHVWERNATRLQVNPASIECIELSHWHRDHSGGMLKVLDMISGANTDAGVEKHVTVDLHPARPDHRGFQAPGMPIVSLEADPSFDAITEHGGMVSKHDEAHAVLGDMFLVSGEIPRLTEYERGLVYGMRYNAAMNTWQSDERMRDERLLMCKLKGKGIVVFTGCSHAGVVNAATHAVELGGWEPLYAVMGGFHLADAQPEQISRTVADLKALDPSFLLTGHCTGWRAKFEVQQQMPGRLVPSFVGSQFVL